MVLAPLLDITFRVLEFYLLQGEEQGDFFPGSPKGENADLSLTTISEG